MRILRFVLGAALLLTASCSGGSRGSAPADDCTALQQCCASLPPSQSGTCSQQEAQAQPKGTSACQAFLNGYHAANLCTGVGSNLPDGGSADGGGLHDAGQDAHSAQPSICARYIDCVSAVTPNGLPAALQAYGPSGTCWSSTPAVASDCVTACTSGVAQLHSADPGACPLCKTNADCAGNPSGPACAQGDCVACSVNADCAGNPSGPACNTATHTCVPCMSDAQCTSAGAPHCDTYAHKCVGCTAASQCPSHICYQQSCCTPKPCNTTQAQCGTVDNGCGGTVSCGTCALGTCQSNTCTTVGVACTPGASGQCVAGEKCIPDGWHQDYRCSPTDVVGSSCSSYPLTTCDSYKASDNTPVDTFTCVDLSNGTSVCKQNCLTQADCPTGTTCTPWSAAPGQPEPISPSIPGQCL